MKVRRMSFESKKLLFLFGVLMTPIFVMLFSSPALAQLSPGLAPIGFDEPGANIGSESGSGVVGNCIGIPVERDASRFAVTLGLDAKTGDCSLVSGLGEQFGANEAAITFYPGSRPEFFELGYWSVQSSSAGTLEKVDPAFPLQIVTNVPDGQAFTFIVSCEACGNAQFEIGAMMQGRVVTINSVEKLQGEGGGLFGFLGGGDEKVQEQQPEQSQMQEPEREKMPCACSKYERQLSQLRAQRESIMTEINDTKRNIRNIEQVMTPFYSQGFGLDALNTYISENNLSTLYGVTSAGFDEKGFANNAEARGDWYADALNKMQIAKNRLLQSQWSAENKLLSLDTRISAVSRAYRDCVKRCVQYETALAAPENTKDCSEIQKAYKDVQDKLDSLDCAAKKAMLASLQKQQKALEDIDSEINKARNDYKKTAEAYKKYFQDNYKTNVWAPDGYNDPSFGRYGFLAYGKASSNAEAESLLQFVKQHQNEISRLQADVNAAHARFQTLSNIQQSAPQKLQDIQAQIAQLMEDIEKCDAAREQLEQEAAQLRRQNEECLQALATVKSEADMIRGEHSMIESELGGSRDLLESFDAVLPKGWQEEFIAARSQSGLDTQPCEQRIAQLEADARALYQQARNNHQLVSDKLGQFDAAWDSQQVDRAQQSLASNGNLSAREAHYSAKSLLEQAREKMQQAIALRKDCLSKIKTAARTKKQQDELKASNDEWDALISGRNLPFEDGPFVISPTDIKVRLQGELAQAATGIDNACDCPNSMLLAAHNAIATSNISEFLWGVGLAPLRGALQALPAGSLAQEGAKALADGALDLLETGDAGSALSQLLVSRISGFTANAVVGSAAQSYIGQQVVDQGSKQLSDTQVEGLFDAMQADGYQMIHINSEQTIQGVEQCNKKVKINMIVMYDPQARHMQIIVTSPECKTAIMMSWTFDKDGVSNGDMRGRIVNADGSLNDIDDYIN